jgi:hypothetical protein
MDSNLLQSDQSITPADFPGLTDAHSRDSFLLESAKFNFQPQLQQPLSSLGDITGLQGQQGPNRLELPGPDFSSPNYTSLGQLVNGEPHPFGAPSGQSSGFPAPLAYFSNNEATAQPNRYTRAEDIITPLPAVFDPRRTNIMESRKNWDTLSIHQQNIIAESQGSLEGESSNEMFYCDMWKPPAPTKIDLANGEGVDYENYPPVSRLNINAKTTAAITGVGENWLSDSNFKEGKALDPPEILGAAAEYYTLPPSIVNSQTTASLTSVSNSIVHTDTSQVPPVYNLSNLSPITSARKGNKGKIRKVARALAAFGNRLATRAPDQFDDSGSRSGPDFDYPKTPGEERRNRALPHIKEQYNQYREADGNATPVLRENRPSSICSLASSIACSIVSERDFPAGWPEDFRPQQRQLTFELRPSVCHGPASTTSTRALPKSLQLNRPPSSVDEVRGLGLSVAEEAVLAKMDKPIAGKAASMLETNTSAFEDKESPFRQLLRRGSPSKFSISTFRNERAGQLSSGKHAADENMAGLDELSNPDQILQSQRGDNDVDELDLAKIPSFGAFGSTSSAPAQFNNSESAEQDLPDERVDEIYREFDFRSAESVMENDMDVFEESFNGGVTIPDSITQDMSLTTEKYLQQDETHEYLALAEVISGESTETEIGADPPTSFKITRDTDDFTIEDSHDSHVIQSAKATNPAPPTMKRTSIVGSDIPPKQLRTSTSQASIDPERPRKVGPAPPPFPPPPMSISNQAVLSDDLEIHELFTPEQDSWWKEVAAVASSKAEITRVAKKIDLSTPSPGWVEPSSDYDPTIEATLRPEERKWMKGTPARGDMEQEMRGPGRLEVAESLLEDVIRSVEEGSHVVPPSQPRPRSAHEKDDSFDSIRYYPVLPCNIEGRRKGFPAMEERRYYGPFNTRNKMGERKANRKKAQEAQKTQYCGPGGPCIWVLCLPCVAVEVVKLGGEVVGMYGRKGVEMVRGWIRGLKKGKMEGR